MIKGTILYVGNYELPDKGASANRVVANGKIFGKLGFHTVFLGVNKEMTQRGIRPLSVTNVMYEEAYPKGSKEWFRHMVSVENIKILASKYQDLSMIILYNVPFSLLFMTKWAFRKTNIKVIYDCTEWNGETEGNIAKRAIKILDEYLIRRYAGRMAHAMIVISNRMKEAYSHNGRLLQLPPLIDLRDPIWHQKQEKEDNQFEFCYAGMLNGTKERLDNIVAAFAKLKEKECILRIIGVTKEEFLKYYPDAEQILNQVKDRVIFMGLRPHEETIGYVKNCDCYIFIREATRRNNAGFPTKFAEAYSCGVDIITTDISDIAFYMKDKKRGQLLSDVSVEKAAHAMEMAIKNKNNKNDKEKQPDTAFHYETYIEECRAWLDSF